MTPAAVCLHCFLEYVFTVLVTFTEHIVVRAVMKLERRKGCGNHDVLPNSTEVPNDCAAFERMLFFDDEMRNIIEIRGFGVTCVHVEEGIHRSLFQSGIRATRFEQEDEV